MILLLNLLISQPDTGSEQNEPAGKANKISPRLLSEMFSFCRMVGIRDAQDAKQSPKIKNSAPIAMR